MYSACKEQSNWVAVRRSANEMATIFHVQKSNMSTYPCLMATMIIDSLNVQSGSGSEPKWENFEVISAEKSHSRTWCERRVNRIQISSFKAKFEAI